MKGQKWDNIVCAIQVDILIYLKIIYASAACTIRQKILILRVNLINHNSKKLEVTRIAHKTSFECKFLNYCCLSPPLQQ